MVNALVITGFGLNCERETAAAFELAGATATQVHLNKLIEDPSPLEDAHILAFIGGFSFGDHLGAGTVFSNRVQATLGDNLAKFIADGKLIIGICNGFQTITRLGLVPALDGQDFNQTAALTRNDSGVFRDAWITVKANQNSPCVFTKGLDELPLPIRHGEGKFVTQDADTLARLEAANLVALRYVDPDTDEPATEFPDNPNGSANAIAGICDPTGRIFGLMPHPEAYLSPFNHPHWVRQRINGVLPKEGLGATLFRNAVEFAKEELV
jgi:phosphoribosylformylglycinamidine synthase